MKEYNKFSLETDIHHKQLCEAEQKLGLSVQQTDKDKFEFDKLWREFDATDGPDVFLWRARLSKQMLNCRSHVCLTDIRKYSIHIVAFAVVQSRDSLCC